MNFNAISLFSSAGVAETYFSQHGVDVKVAAELLPERVALYRHLYPSTEMIQGDITDKKIFKMIIEKAKENNCNFLIATPPCQGMSTAGKQKKDDARNRLIIEVISAIKKINPCFVIIENVSEILLTKIEIDGKWVLIDDYLKSQLSSNYLFNERKVVNAMNYGVAQSRERCVYLLSRKDQNVRWEFPEPLNHITTMKDAIGDLPSLDPDVTDITEKERMKLFPDYYRKKAAGIAVSKWHYPPRHKYRHVIAMMHTPEGCSAFDKLQTNSYTIQKAVNQLKNTAIELGTAIMQVLAPIITSLSEKISALTKWFSGLSDGTKQTIVVIAMIVAAIGPVLIIVGKVISAVGTIMTIIPKLAGVINTVKTAFAALNVTMLANPIILIIAAIAALVAAFIYLWNTNEDFRQFWIDLWENIKEVAIAVWNAIKDFFIAVWEGIKVIAETVWNALSSYFSAIWDGIKVVFETVLNVIVTIVTTYFNIYKTIIETVLNVINTVFTTIWNAISTVVTTVVNAISTFLTTAWTAIQTTITTIINTIKEVITTVWNAISTAVATAVNAIKNTITTIWNNIKSTVTSVVNGIKTAVSSTFTAIWNGIKTTIGGIYDTIKGGFDKAVNFIKGLASSAFTWGKDMVMGIVNGIKSCIGAVGDAVKGVADKITSFLHFSVPDEGPLTEYESWMPDFMEGLAKGINQSKGLVEKAVSGVAADMMINPQVGTMDFAGANGSISSTSDTDSSIVGAIRDAVSGMNGQSGDIVIPIYLGGTMLDEVIINAGQRMNLRSGGR